MPTSIPLNILIADDDKSDRYFFEKALKALTIPTRLVALADGEKLMTYLLENTGNLPDVLFLDLNMARKNGTECLKEIKNNPDLKNLPVIIYSTSLNEHVGDDLYEMGATYYIEKRDYSELIEILQYLLSMLIETNFARPERDAFVPVMSKIY